MCISRSQPGQSLLCSIRCVRIVFRHAASPIAQRHRTGCKQLPHNHEKNTLCPVSRKIHARKRFDVNLDLTESGAGD